mgnify:CR=1 FL=1
MAGFNGSHHGRPTASEIGGDPMLRIIAVGDSDRARALGRDGRLEVVRARDGFEAIGEAGLTGTEDRVCPTVVLLAPDAVDARDLEQFVQAVHLVDPTTRVVISNAKDVLPSRIEGLDTIGSDPTPDALLQLVNAVESDPREDSADDGTAIPLDHAPSDLEAMDDETLRIAGRTDGTLLRALLAGRDLGEVCLHQMRSTLGESVRFIAREDDKAHAPSIALDESLQPVTHRDTLLGWLIGPSEAQGDLELEADRLALALVVDRQQRQLRDSAFVDHLTGAWNRRYFERSMESLLLDARERRIDLTLLLFDIDDFKIYNDRYGHAAGDEILVETVRLLRAMVRPGDRVCRVGGDEFAVIFYEPSGPRAPGSHPPRSIFEIATRFQRAICEHRFPKLGEDARANLSISGGLATFPWDGHDLHTLMEHADRLLIQSKREGKNALCLGPGALRACGGLPEQSE